MRPYALLLLLFQNCLSSSGIWIRIHHEYYTQKASFTLSNYHPKIQELVDLSRGVHSFTLSGIWLLYEDTNYNKGVPKGKVIYGWGANHIIKSVPFKVSSLRYVGAKEGLEFNTLTFYEDPDFNGDEEMYFKDVPLLSRPFFGQSLILTGMRAWTLFSEENFHGEHVCVYPGSKIPGFFEKPEAFGGFVNKVMSVRQGCFSPKKYMGLKLRRNVTRFLNYY